MEKIDTTNTESELLSLSNISEKYIIRKNSIHEQKPYYIENVNQIIDKIKNAKEGDKHFHIQ